MRKKFVFITVFVFVVVGSFLIFLGTKNNINGSNSKKSVVPEMPTSVPTPTPEKAEPFGRYTAPKIAKKEVSTIFMVGDSMTEALGPHGGKFNEFINKRYKSTPGHQKIVIDNYAKGSTNILGLHSAMKQKTVVGDAVLEPLLYRPFDIILVESFGYNPLSQLGTQEGIIKQTETLDLLMWTLTEKHPDSVIVFVATIAPNKEMYSIKVNPNTSLDERKEQAEERMVYIKNHIDYAKSHNIPLINIFEKSLTEKGDGNLKYINPNDYVHPSFEGVDFISQEIANYIYENQIIPR